MNFLPSKSDMDQAIQGIAGEVETRMIRWKVFAEKMDSVTDQQLLDLGYTSTQAAYIRSMVVALKNIELRYRNEDPLNTDNPSLFIREMTRILVL